MTLFGFIYTFVLGAIVGSFLNVVALRYNTGRSVGGRSSCFSCKHALSWYELVPIASFLFLRGRCRKCKSKISWQYPLVELLTALLFSALYLKVATMPIVYTFGMFAFAYLYLYYAVVFAVLIVILVYDFRHKIIPDGLVYSFDVLALVSLVCHPTGAHMLAGPILFLPFYLLWKISDGKWIGLGDGKLALGIGWLLGLVDGIGAVALAFWIGALVGLIVLSLPRKKFTIKSEIPFAPFLILGLLLIFFFRWDVVGLHAILSLSQ